jgi:REG-2-like HAD superfamily hydrolase
MSARLVSFDAADTLIAVNWSPGRFAVDRAEEIGIYLDRQVATEAYDRLLYSRWKDYQQLNINRDGSDNEARCDAFWCELTTDWLQKFARGGRANDLVSHANMRMLATDSPVYRVYDDVLDTLAAIKAKGIPMVVLSNWDYSLHRVLKAFGLSPWFDFVFASLEYGPEKPEAALFREVESQMGVSPEEIVHIGDNPIDDLHGAINAGWRAALIDRSLPERDGHRLSDLRQVIDLL